MDKRIIKMDKANTENLNRKLLVFLMIVIFGMLCIGTYAWLSNRLDDTALVLTFGEIDGLSVTVKPYKVESTLSPVSGYTYGESIEVTANNRTSENGKFNLFYVINSISNELKSSDFKYKIMKSTDGGSTYTSAKEDNFLSATTEDNFIIFEDIVPGNTIYLYKVYLWIQESGGDQSSLQNKTFDGELRASFIDILPIPPVLDAGMIPVKIAANGSVTVVNKDDETWYDYENGQWANVVMVKATGGTHTRAEYLAASAAGTANYTVAAADILAYYVWIPRFSYKIWYTGTAVQTGNEQLIEIEFTNIKRVDTGTSVGEMRTNPAFTFLGDQIAGFWIGKFEPTHATNTAQNMSCSSENCSNADNIRILPNVQSLRNNTVKSFFYAGRSLQRSGNPFGLSTASTTNSHMGMGSEWGAVAYLSHSQYGIGNNEVRINNQNSYKTGCGASTANAAGNGTCQIAYGGSSNGTYPQSTTGNISGVFDMSGGAGEYLMQNYNNKGKSSGFSDNALPSGYYNMYTFNSASGCTIQNSGGHGMCETLKWYNDTLDFAGDNVPFYIRGGSYTDTNTSGIFFTQAKDGAASSWRSTRYMIVVK